MVTEKMNNIVFYASPVAIRLEKSVKETGKELQHSLIMKSKKISQFSTDDYPKSLSNKAKLVQKHKLLIDKRNRRERQLLSSCFQMFSRQKIQSKLFVENST